MMTRMRDVMMPYDTSPPYQVPEQPQRPRCASSLPVRLYTQDQLDWIEEHPPLVLGGQGRDAIDTDLFWAMALALVWGVLIGALTGWGLCWMIMR